MSLRLLCGLATFTLVGASGMATATAESVSVDGKTYECAFLVATSTGYVGLHMNAAPKMGMISPIGVYVRPSKAPGGYDLIVRESEGKLTRYAKPIGVAARSEVSGSASFIFSSTDDEGATDMTTVTLWDMKGQYPQAIMRRLITPRSGAWGADGAALTKPNPLTPELDRKVTDVLSPVTFMDAIGDCDESAIRRADERYSLEKLKKAGRSKQ